MRDAGMQLIFGRHARTDAQTEIFRNAAEKKKAQNGTEQNKKKTAKNNRKQFCFKLRDQENFSFLVVCKEIKPI